MKNNQSIALSIDSKEGMFRVTKDITFFHEHETVLSLKENIKMVIKELKKLSKNNPTTLDIMSQEQNNYTRNSNYRYVLDCRGWNSTFELDTRKFNGLDFSNSQLLNFTSSNELFKYLAKDMTKRMLDIMHDIPEDGNTLYGLELAAKREEMEVAQ